MKNTAAKGSCEIGVAGMGVMGRNLLFNFAEAGFPAAAYTGHPKKLPDLEREGAGLPVAGTADLIKFVLLLRRPRAVLLMIPAGPAVDAAIAALAPLLERGDLIIDAGNSHYADTGRRETELKAKGLRFMGMGVSGGEEGARNGPSIMAGGEKAAYARVRKMLEAVSAKAGGEPCAALVGSGSAGHFVKMTHNGIEYAFMQLIAETYDLMKRGLGLKNERLAEVYSDWAGGELNSYLLEITAEILRRRDAFTGKALVDLISDSASQKGTGAWTSESALRLKAPAPCIDAAVAMRALSAMGAERTAAAGGYSGASAALPGSQSGNLRRLGDALYAAMALTYVQGFSLLSAASEEYGYGLKTGIVAGIWRGGCIIRSAMLADIREACLRNDGRLFRDRALAKKIMARRNALAAAVSGAALAGLPAPAFMSALAYLDALRSRRLPLNLVQAQRDYFGAHTYERIDRNGTFHTDWKK